MRAGVLAAARFALLAGPTALAFFSGGYFDESRAWTGLGAWVLVLAAFLADPRALPRGREAWLAFGGLALLGGWTLRSITWAPIRGNAYHAGQIVFLYVGALLASASLLGEQCDSRGDDRGARSAAQRRRPGRRLRIRLDLAVPGRGGIQRHRLRPGARQRRARETPGGALGWPPRFEVAEHERLPPGDRVDAILLFDALHHSTRQSTTLRSVAGRLRPGG